MIRSLHKTIDASALALFRILFGTLMTIHLWAFNSPGIIKERFVDVNFFFSYPLFHLLHLKPLAGDWWYLFFLVMGLFSIGITLGFFYRISSIGFFICFLYFFLLERAYSPTPHYLYLWLSVLFMFTNAHATFSIDSFQKRISLGHKVPIWMIYVFRFQIGLAFFYSGFGKLTHPDWLHARQLFIWLKTFTHVNVLGTTLTTPLAAHIFSFSGIIFDMSIGILLCFKRTRTFGICLAIFFHVFNKFLLNLYSVPMFMLATLIIFYDPAEPRILIKKIKKTFHIQSSEISENNVPPSVQPQNSKFIIILSLYLMIQVLVPLRHFLYPCSTNWTHRGQEFCWQFMNNNMWTDIRFRMSRPQNLANFDPMPMSEYQYQWMTNFPDMIMQYVHYLRGELIESDVDDPEIYVYAEKSLNGREPCALFDSNVNLANKKFSLFECPDWLMPHPDVQGCKIIEKYKQ